MNPRATRQTDPEFVTVIVSGLESIERRLDSISKSLHEDVSKVAKDLTDVEKDLSKHTTVAWTIWKAASLIGFLFCVVFGYFWSDLAEHRKAMIAATTELREANKVMQSQITALQTQLSDVKSDSKNLEKRISFIENIGHNK